MKRGSRFYAAAFTNPTPPAMATLWAGEDRARRFLSAWDRQCRRLRLLFRQPIAAMRHAVCARLVARQKQPGASGS